MVGRKNSLLVTKRSLRNADSGSGKRPRRIVPPKLLDDTVGMSRQEEQELNKALYASLNENRRSKSMPSLTSLVGGDFFDGNSSNGNGNSLSSCDSSGPQGNSSSGFRIDMGVSKASPSKSGMLSLGKRRAARSGNPHPKRLFRRSDSAVHRSKSNTNQSGSTSRGPTGNLAVDESSQDSVRSSSSSANGSKKKIHAQRKFAQGCSLPGTPTSMPTKTSTPPVKLLSHAPKTEDFLTFLCLRGSSVLPPHLDFFNFSREELPPRSESLKGDSCGSRGKRTRETIPDENSSTSSGANEEIVEAAVTTPNITHKNVTSQSKRSAARASAGTPETARGIVSLRQGLQRKVSSSSSSSSSSPHLCVSSSSRTVPDTSHHTNPPPCLYKPKFYFIPEKASPSEASGVLPGEFTPPSKARFMSKHSPLIFRPSPSELSLRASSSRRAVCSSSSSSSSSSPSSVHSSSSGAGKRKPVSTFFSSHSSCQVTDCCPALAPCFAVQNHFRLGQQQASSSLSYRPSVSPSPPLTSPSPPSHHSDSYFFSSSPSSSNSLCSVRDTSPSSPPEMSSSSSNDIHFTTDCSFCQETPSSSHHCHCKDAPVSTKHHCHLEAKKIHDEGYFVDEDLSEVSTYHPCCTYVPSVHSNPPVTSSCTSYSSHPSSTSTLPADAPCSQIIQSDSIVPYSSTEASRQRESHLLVSPSPKQSCNSCILPHHVNPSYSSSTSSFALHGHFNRILPSHAECLCMEFNAPYTSSNRMNSNNSNKTSHQVQSVLHLTGESNFSHQAQDHLLTDGEDYLSGMSGDEGESVDGNDLCVCCASGAKGNVSEQNLNEKAGEDCLHEVSEEEDINSEESAHTSGDDGDQEEWYSQATHRKASYRKALSCCKMMHKDKSKNRREVNGTKKKQKGLERHRKVCPCKPKKDGMIPKLRIKLLKGNKAVIKKSRKSKTHRDNHKANDFQKEFMKMLETDDTCFDSQAEVTPPKNKGGPENNQMGSNVHDISACSSNEIASARVTANHRKKLMRQDKVAPWDHAHCQSQPSLFKQGIGASGREQRNKALNRLPKPLILRKLAVRGNPKLTAFNPALESENEFSTYCDSDTTFTESVAFEENDNLDVCEELRCLQFDYGMNRKKNRTSQSVSNTIVNTSMKNKGITRYGGAHPNLTSFESNVRTAANQNRLSAASTFTNRSGFLDNLYEEDNNFIHDAANLYSPKPCHSDHIIGNKDLATHDKEKPLNEKGQSSDPHPQPLLEKEETRKETVSVIPEIINPLNKGGSDSTKEKGEDDIPVRMKTVTPPVGKSKESEPPLSDADISAREVPASDAEETCSQVKRSENGLSEKSRCNNNCSCSSSESDCGHHADYQCINMLDIQVSNGDSALSSSQTSHMPSVSVRTSMCHGRGKPVAAHAVDKSLFNSLPSSPTFMINFTIPKDCNSKICNNSTKHQDSDHVPFTETREAKNQNSSQKDSTSSADEDNLGDKVEIFDPPLALEEKDKDKTSNSHKEEIQIIDSSGMGKCSKEEKTNKFQDSQKPSTEKNIEPFSSMGPNSMPNKVTDSCTQTEPQESNQDTVDCLKVSSKNKEGLSIECSDLWQKRCCFAQKKAMKLGEVIYKVDSSSSDEEIYYKKNPCTCTVSLTPKPEGDPVIIGDDDDDDDVQIVEDEKKVIIKEEHISPATVEDLTKENGALDLSVSGINKCESSFEETSNPSNSRQNSLEDVSNAPRPVQLFSAVSINPPKVTQDNATPAKNGTSTHVPVVLNQSIVMPSFENTGNAVYPVSITRNTAYMESSNRRGCLPPISLDGCTSTVSRYLQASSCTSTTPSNAPSTSACNLNQNSSEKETRNLLTFDRNKSVNDQISPSSIKENIHRQATGSTLHTAGDNRIKTPKALSAITLHSFGSLCTGQGYTFVQGKPQECDILNRNKYDPQSGSQNPGGSQNIPLTVLQDCLDLQRTSLTVGDKERAVINKEGGPSHSAPHILNKNTQPLSNIDLEKNSKDSGSRKRSQKGKTSDPSSSKASPRAKSTMKSQSQAPIMNSTVYNSKRGAVLSDNALKLKKIGSKSFDSSLGFGFKRPPVIQQQRASFDEPLFYGNNNQYLALSSKGRINYLPTSSGHWIRVGHDAALNNPVSNNKTVYSDCRLKSGHLPRTPFELRPAFPQVAGSFPPLQANVVPQSSINAVRSLAEMSKAPSFGSCIQNGASSVNFTFLANAAYPQNSSQQQSWSSVAERNSNPLHTGQTFNLPSIVPADINPYSNIDNLGHLRAMHPATHHNPTKQLVETSRSSVIISSGNNSSSNREKDSNNESGTKGSRNTLPTVLGNEKPQQYVSRTSTHSASSTVPTSLSGARQVVKPKARDISENVNVLLSSNERLLAVNKTVHLAHQVAGQGSKGHRSSQKPVNLCLALSTDSVQSMSPTSRNGPNQYIPSNQPATVVTSSRLQEPEPGGQSDLGQSGYWAVPGISGESMGNIEQSTLFPETFYSEATIPTTLNTASSLGTVMNPNILNPYSPSSSDLRYLAGGDDGNVLDVIMEELKEQIRQLREEIRLDSMSAN